MGRGRPPVRGRRKGAGGGLPRLRHAGARSLGLRGGAANLPNGNVRLWVAGPEHALERFEAALHEGPRTARVDSLQCESIDLSLVTSDTYDVEF